MTLVRSPLCALWALSNWHSGAPRGGGHQISFRLATLVRLIAGCAPGRHTRRILEESFAEQRPFARLTEEKSGRCMALL